MYKLLNDETITSQIKDAFKKGITRAYLKVLATEENEEDLIINEDNYLQSIDLDDSRYYESEGIIGTVIAKSLEGKFINVDSSFNIENKEIECYIGAEVGNTVKYLKFGTFIVQKPENDNVKDNTTFEALDYMIKFNKKFEDRLNYNDPENPITISDLLEDICDQAGVTCGTTTFRNSDFILENNQFVENETCRDVLKAIAQMAFSWARINEDDELVLDFDIIDNTTETIDYDEYMDLKTNNEYGPLNTIILRNSQVEGENYTLIDPDMQPGDEVCELVINDNPFAYTQEKRTQLAQAGSALFGFRYIPFKLKTIGAIYLNCLDSINIKNMQDQFLQTYIFNNIIRYDGTVHDEKQTQALTKTETRYKFLGDVSEKIRKTELIVDKQNQEIKSIVSITTSLDENTSKNNADLLGKIGDVQGNLNDYKLTVDTKFEEQSGSFEASITRAISPINDTTDELNGKINEIKDYLRYELIDGVGVLTLGKSDSPILLRERYNKVYFEQNGVEVAYISDNKLYITNGEFLERLKIGSFAYTPRANGSLTFGKVV